MGSLELLNRHFEVCLTEVFFIISSSTISIEIPSFVIAIHIKTVVHKRILLVFTTFTCKINMFEHHEVLHQARENEVKHHAALLNAQVLFRNTTARKFVSNVFIFCLLPMRIIKMKAQK